jgi:hypothetical protein
VTRPDSQNERIPPLRVIGTPATSETDRDDESPGPAGRVGRHVVDRALEYQRLARAGCTPSDIARRKRRSRAHVSILLRFGEVLTRVHDIEASVLRHPKITYKLLQRVIRRGTDDRTIYRALLSAITMPETDGRRRRRLRLPPPPPPVDPNAFTFEWDPSWAERDPLGYLDALEAYLRRVQRGVDHRLRTLLRERTISAPAQAQQDSSVATVMQVAHAGGSLRALRAAMRQPQVPSHTSTFSAPEAGATERAILMRLAELDDLMRGLERRPSLDADEG